MKFRNRILALACLLLFAGFGIVFFKKWVRQRPFGIILILSDSLDSRTLAPARLFAGGADQVLFLDSLPSGLLRFTARDTAVPDAAATASLFATGQPGNRGAVSLDPAGSPAPLLFDLARASGRATGLVTNGSISDPFTAAFYGHAPDIGNPDALAAQLLGKGAPDMILGGGAKSLLPELKEGSRKDSRDLFLEMRQAGYEIVRNRDELENVPTWKRPRTLGIFADTRLAWRDEAAQASYQPTLSDMVRRSIEMLQYNREGYLLVIDAGQARIAGSENQSEHLLEAICELDEAVRTAVKYAGEKSLVIVAGTGSTGGFNLTAHPFRADKGFALLGKNSAGLPSVTWASGPNGPGSSATNAADQPAAVYSESAMPVAADSLLFWSGEPAPTPPGNLPAQSVFGWIQKNL